MSFGMTRPEQLRANRRRLAGFTLIEILISMVVLSFGLLGTAAMQIDGLRSVQESVFRTEAMLLANQMVERMRANVPGSLAGNYVGLSAPSTIDCNGIANVCDNAAMAVYDRGRWHAGLQTLPSGRGTVFDLGADRYSVRVQWDERRTGASGENCPPTSKTDMRCFELSVSP